MNKASFSFPRNFKQFQAIRSKFIYIFIQDVKILLSKSFQVFFHEYFCFFSKFMY